MVPQALFRGGSVCAVMTCGQRDPTKEVDFRGCAAASPFEFRIEELTREAMLDGAGVTLLVIRPPSQARKEICDVEQGDK